MEDVVFVKQEQGARNEEQGGGTRELLVGGIEMTEGDVNTRRLNGVEATPKEAQRDEKGGKVRGDFRGSGFLCVSTLAVLELTLETRLS